MAVAVNDIVDKAEIILQDTTNVRWASSELVGWLNDGQNQVVIHKADASVTNAAVALSAGTKQTLPTGGIILTKITRNMGTDGTTAGDAIRVIDAEILDAQVPDWHSETAATTVKHYVFDVRDPLNYYVYPQSTGTNYVEVVYSSAPSAASAGGNITIADIYSNVLLDYILFRAYQKDADYAVNDQRVIAYFNQVLGALGVLEVSEDKADPNLNATLTTTNRR